MEQRLYRLLLLINSHVLFFFLHFYICWRNYHFFICWKKSICFWYYSRHFTFIVNLSLIGIVFDLMIFLNIDSSMWTTRFAVTILWNYLTCCLKNQHRDCILLSLKKGNQFGNLSNADLRIIFHHNSNFTNKNAKMVFQFFK